MIQHPECTRDEWNTVSSEGQPLKKSYGVTEWLGGLHYSPKENDWLSEWMNSLLKFCH